MSDQNNPESNDGSSTETAAEDQSRGTVAIAPEFALAPTEATGALGDVKVPTMEPRTLSTDVVVKAAVPFGATDPTAVVSDAKAPTLDSGTLSTDVVKAAELAAPTPVPFDPKTAFSKGRKAGTLAVLTAWAFAGSFPNVVISPGLPQIQVDLDTTAQAVNGAVAVATFISGLAPLWWSAVSDLKGRRVVFLISGPILIASSIAGYWTPNIAVFYVIRIIQQAAGAAVVSTGSGTLTDIYPRAELASVLGTFYVDLGGAARTGAGDGAVERGIYYSIDNHHLLQQLGLTLGPTIGPAIGGAIIQYAGWRWTFVASAILAAVVFVPVVFFLPETGAKRPPGAAKENPFLKPFKTLAYNRYPFVLSVVSVIAMIFAVLFVMTVTIPRDFPAVYGFTTAQAGLVQLVSGIGMLLGTYISGRYSDYVFRAWHTKRGIVVPEDRLRATWPGIVTLTIGCLMMGWALVTAVHWAVPATGAFITGFAIMSFATSCNSYLIDLFQGNASSITASANFLRFTLAAIVPLTVRDSLLKLSPFELFTRQKTDNETFHIT